MAESTGSTRLAFGEVVRLSKERTSDPDADGFDRYVGLEHIAPGDLRIRRWGNVADGTTFTNIFRPGQVLFGKRRAYQGKVAIAGFEGVCSGDIYVLESLDASVLLPELLPFICQTDAFLDHAVGTSAGSLSPRTNWASISSFEFDLPGIDEQRMLASALQRIDELQYSLESSARAAEATVNALSADLGRRSHNLTTIGEAVEDLEAGVSLAARNSPAEPGGFGVLKVSAVGNWDFDPRENKRIAESSFAPAAQVRVGDLLATRANADPEGVGRTCLVTDPTPAYLMLSDKTWRLRLRNAYASFAPGICAWTKSQLFRSHVRAHLGGTDAKNISQSRFLAAPFPRVPIDEFARFSEAIEATRNAQRALQIRRESLRDLRIGVLNGALS